MSVKPAVIATLWLLMMGAIPARAEGLPAAEPETTKNTYHGVEVADPYRWLENSASPKSKSWLAAQNKYTDEFFERSTERAYFRRRLAQLIPEFRDTEPVRYGNRFFSWRRTDLESQPILRVKGPDDTEPKVLLDPNQLSRDNAVFLAGHAISPDGRWVLYWTSKNGREYDEAYHLLSVETGQEVGECNTGLRIKAAFWNRSGTGFFYSGWRRPRDRKPGPMEDEGIYYHRIGESASNDRAVVPPGKDGNALRATLTADGRYLLVSIHSLGTQPEIKLLCLDLGTGLEPSFDQSPKIISEHWGATYPLVGSIGSVLFLMSTTDAPRGQLLAVDVERPSKEKWKVVVPESDGTLRAVCGLMDYFVAVTVSEIGDHLRLYKKSGEPCGDVPLPGVGTATVFPQAAPEYFEYNFATGIMPPCRYRYTFATGKSEQIGEPELFALASRFESKIVHYQAPDGTQIPMQIMHRKGLQYDGRNPLILHGYGGFGLLYRPQFSRNDMVWMERGGIVAVPTLRGDGGMGEDWHRAGMKAGKLTTISDLLAAAEWLCANHYTSPISLVVVGHSNGAVVAAAAVNQRPDLFRVALLDAGPMDMLRWHKLSSDQGASCKEEYGTSDTADEFEFLRQYSPLHNIKTDTRYPACFIHTGDHDDRVSPAHSYKYAAALQAMLQETMGGGGPVILRMERNAGHLIGLKSTQRMVDEWAEELAFAAYFTMDN